MVEECLTYVGTEGWKLIRALPPDPESPGRALTFIRHINDNSPEGLELFKEVYSLAATGQWPILQQDISMLVYSVRLNPGLLPLVAPSVEALIKSFPVGMGIRKEWQWVRECCCRDGL